MKAFLTRLFDQAFQTNSENIIGLGQRLTTRGGSLRMCDLGCGDGALTARIAEGVGACEVDVVETFDPHVDLAESRGFHVTRADLNGRLPLETDRYDVVVSNQVIEHLYDTDMFVEESIRIARPGGVIIISTENPSSWHNIGATVLGWQPFSTTNISSKAAGVGNPFALHGGETGNPFPMQHHRLLTIRALRDVVELHGAGYEACAGAGYYPLDARVGRWDPMHAHFITVAARKPMN